MLIRIRIIVLKHRNNNKKNNQGRGLIIEASIGLPAMGRSWRPANGSGKANGNGMPEFPASQVHCKAKQRTWVIFEFARGHALVGSRFC